MLQPPFANFPVGTRLKQYHEAHYASQQGYLPRHRALTLDTLPHITHPEHNNVLSSSRIALLSFSDVPPNFHASLVAVNSIRFGIAATKLDLIYLTRFD